MEKIKIVFIGGLTNGRIVFDYLVANKFVELVLVITYPDDSSKPRHVNFPSSSFIIKDGKANNHVDQILDLNPDLIIVAGWSELLDDKLLSAPSGGVIGFHPSKLPYDRGRSVVAWQIEEGYTDTALSMFYYNDIPDGGDIIAQDRIVIEENDYVNDVLNKVDAATLNLMRAYFPLIREGKAPRRQQSINEGNFRRLRDDKDSELNWNTNARVIYNKIRAISKPYPGVKAVIEHSAYRIYEAKIVHFPFETACLPGDVAAKLYDDSWIIKCRDAYIQIINYEKCE